MEIPAKTTEVNKKRIKIIQPKKIRYEKNMKETSDTSGRGLFLRKEPRN